jgi:predicted aspartyl protease/Flp pilus assembly protein TadD
MQTFRVSVVAAAFVVAVTLVGRAADAISAPDAELQYQLGNLLFEDTRYQDALAAYDKATKSTDRRLALRARKGKIRTALVVAEFALAREEAAQLRLDAPDDVDVLTLSADALWASGQFDEADQLYADVFERSPTSSRARFGMARSLATVNRLDEALSHAQVASAAAPRDGEIHFQIGDIYQRMHLYQEAANAYANFINLLPKKNNNSQAAWSRAEVTFLRAFEGQQPIEIDPALLEKRHTMPFKLVKGKVMVEGKINGGRAMEFVLDTGSEETNISEDTARKLGVRPITYTLSAGVGDVGLRGLQLGKLDTLELGSLKVSNVPVLIKSPGLTGLPKRENDSLSPLALGLSVSIDYRNRLVTMGKSIPPSGREDFTLPMRINRLALVRGMLNNKRPANFVVDTGGEVISISTTVAASLDTPIARHIPLKVFGVSGWDKDAFLMPGVDLAFNDLEFLNMPLVVLNLRVPSALLGFEVGGIVGYRFLSSYHVTMDMARSELRLRRN